MRIIRIEDINDARVRIFGNLHDSELRQIKDCEEGIFIAESPKVIRTCLAQGFRPIALLCEDKHITGDAADIVSSFTEETPIYTGHRKTLSRLTGYVLTRGVLCAMQRNQLPDVEDVVREASRIAIIDGVCDTTNIGNIFRAAAALGIDGILLTRESCDPLNRRSIRVSMGTVFQIPWTWLDRPISSVREFGFTTVALALKEKSISLDNPILSTLPKIAIILGTEGEGLSDEVIEEADYSVIIPMHHDVDSLNVGAAAAVAFWELRKRISNNHP